MPITVKIDEEYWRFYDFQEEFQNLNPETDVFLDSHQVFIEKLISAEYPESNLFKYDCDAEEEYWDCNHSAKHLIQKLATKIQSYFDHNVMVYEFPWKSVVVAYRTMDSGGYDSIIQYKKFENQKEFAKYMKTGDC